MSTGLFEGSWLCELPAPSALLTVARPLLREGVVDNVIALNAERPRDVRRAFGTALEE